MSIERSDDLRVVGQKYAKEEKPWISLKWNQLFYLELSCITNILGKINHIHTFTNICIYAFVYIYIHPYIFTIFTR